MAEGTNANGADGDAVSARAAALILLFVDDEPDNVELFRRQFAGSYDVRTAGSAAEALAILEREDVALVLTDERMPQVSGIELLAKIVEHWPDIVRVIVSAYGDAGRLLRAINHGRAHEYLSVLVRGETGTGKELVARLLHEASRRKTGPFIRVNCAALAEGVLESELFGHEKGSFTGAHTLRRGRFELARGGTIFLDEIGDISPKLQSTLLRVIQEREIERVGGSAPVAVDVRLVTATHRDLEARVKEGLFREDLFYRINVVPIVVPPVRDRPGDVGPLVRHFIVKHAQSARTRPFVSDETVARLAAYAWPGNVREIENLVQRALVLGIGDELTVEDFCLRLDIADGLPAREQAKNAERERLRLLLIEQGGNIARSARKLGAARTTLLSRVKKYGLVP